MGKFLDLTTVNIDEFKNKLITLAVLDKNVIALKITKKNWENPFQQPSYMSEEDLFYMEYYSSGHFEEDNSQRDVPQIEVRKEYINPFDKIHMFWLESSYFIMTDKKYDNNFSGLLDSSQSKILKDFLESRVGFQAYYGQRRFFIDKITPPKHGLIQKINQKWNCEDSEKIQEWYYENNSEYRNEIERAGGRNEKISKHYYEEIYLSNMSAEETKQFVSPFMNYETQLAQGNLFIKIQNPKAPLKKTVHPIESTTIPLVPDYSQSDTEQRDYNDEYNTRARAFHEDNPYDDYSDHLYFERVRDDEE